MRIKIHIGSTRQSTESRSTEPKSTKPGPPKSKPAKRKSAKRRSAEPRLVVVDTETTGFSKADRVVEIACITLSMNGEVVDEYDTLLQPSRDVGPTHIHGITPQMLQSAPTFAEVAADIAQRVDGAVLVAHNLPFDRRMLEQEAKKLDTNFNPGEGVCTYKLSGQKLSVACQQHSVRHDGAHAALGDARATAELFLRLGGLKMLRKGRGQMPASFHPSGQSRGVAVRRPEAPPRQGSLARLVSSTGWPEGLTDNQAMYMDLLDRVLDDFVIEDYERAAMLDLASQLRLTRRDVEDLHSRYYEQLLTQIHADGVVSEEESQMEALVSAALGMDSAKLEVTYQSEGSELRRGMRVCFTGRHVEKTRDELLLIAVKCGLNIDDNVRKKTTDVLVATDPQSQSGKTNAARKYGKPVISVEDFLSQVSGGLR